MRQSNSTGKDRTNYSAINAWIVGTFVILALVLGLVTLSEAQDSGGGGVSKPVPNPAVTNSPGTTGTAGTNTPVPAIAPLSQEEKEDLRVAQIEVRDAIAAYTAIVEDTNKKLLQTTEYHNRQAKMQRLSQLIDRLFTARKIKSDEDAVLCDGPDERPACVGMDKRKLELRPVPKPKSTPPVDADKDKANDKEPK